MYVTGAFKKKFKREEIFNSIMYFHEELVRL